MNEIIVELEKMAKSFVSSMENMSDQQKVEFLREKLFALYYAGFDAGTDYEQRMQKK